MTSYLLNFLLLAFFDVGDLIGTLLGLLNLFPGLHFLLLEQGNAVRK